MKHSNGNPFVVNYANFTNTKLVDAEQNYHPNIEVAEAKKMAQDAELDLVCFNRPDKGNLALCKIINFGKWRYSNEKKKKKEKVGKKTTKEIRLSPGICDHDIDHKIKHVKKFIEDGNDVLFSMKLKGRQRAHFNEAEERMNEIVKLCSGYSQEVSRKKSSGMITVRVSSKQKEA